MSSVSCGGGGGGGGGGGTWYFSSYVHMYFFCRLIINDSLDSGTQLPYIARAKTVG